MNIRHLFKIKPYEHIVFVLRRHWIFLVRNFLALVFFLLLPFAVWYFLGSNFPDLLTGSVSYPLIVLGLSIYLLAIWLFFFSLTLDYYLDIWVVTNDRLIAVEQQGLFSRTISETDLWLVQDVSSEIKGVAATIFGFGKLEVQTAAERARFHFENCQNPNGIRQHILDLADEDRKYHIGNVQMKKIGL